MALNPYTKCSATTTAVATVHKETNIGDVLGNNNVVATQINTPTNYATLRVFGSLLVNIWRAQREDVRMSAKRLAKYKSNLHKARETIRFLNNVIVIEKNHNEKLFAEVRTFSKELIAAYNTNTKLQETIDMLEHKSDLMAETLCELNAENARLLAKLHMQEEHMLKMSEQFRQFEHKYNLSQQRLTRLTAENGMLTQNVCELETLMRQHPDERSIQHRAANAPHARYSNVAGLERHVGIAAADNEHISCIEHIPRMLHTEQCCMRVHLPSRQMRVASGWRLLQRPWHWMSSLMAWLRQYNVCFFNAVLTAPHNFMAII